MKALLPFLVLLATAYSQTFQGSIRGRVVDPTEVAAGGARITLTDEHTQVGRFTVSNDLGEYVFNAVTPSTYTLSVDSPRMARIFESMKLLTILNGAVK